jgi:phosphate:Na+ symporter
MELLENYSDKREKELVEMETLVDRYEDELGAYLIEVSSRNLSGKDSHTVNTLLHSIGNFERIGDHAVNMLKVADEIADKKLAFSPAAERELAVLDRATRDILSLTVDAFCRTDTGAAAKVEPLEQVIDHLIAEIRSRHISRLQKGNCTVEMGFILADLLTNYERVSDHCSNLAVAVIEAKSKEDTAGAHAYLQEVTSSYNFNEVYEQYLSQYAL